MKPTTLSWLIIVAAIGLAATGLADLALVWLKDALVPAGLLFAGIPLAMAVLTVAFGGRLLLLAALVAAIYLWEGLQGAPTAGGLLAEPTETQLFMWLDGLRVLQVVFSAVATVAALGEMGRRLGRQERQATR